MVQGKTVYCANVGDSQAFIYSYQVDESGQKKLIFKELTTVHSPEVSSEAARILSQGGSVRRAVTNGEESGPLRVYQGQSKLPGLMMTRSFGDKIGHSVGVICVPSNTFS